MNQAESAPRSQIKSYSQSLIKTIRAIDAKNLVPTPPSDQKLLDAANDPITGQDNIADRLHISTSTHPKSLHDDTRQAQKKTAIGASEGDERRRPHGLEQLLRGPGHRVARLRDPGHLGDLCDRQKGLKE
jgi:hypothetical protein